MTNWVAAMSAVITCVSISAAPAQAPGGGVLADVHAALGGAAVDAVTSFRAEGTSQRSVGPLRLAGPVELKLIRPERFLRLDTLSIGSSRGETITGFNGLRMIQRASLPGAPTVDAAAALPPEVRKQTLASGAEALRHDLRLLLLGFFGTVYDGSGLIVAGVQLAESPTGQAHALTLTFADDSRATLYVERASALPLVVSWRAPNPLAAIRQIGVEGGGRGAASIEATVVPLAEHRLYFGDYGRVGNVRWPFAIRRAIDGEVVEEIRFTRFDLNPALDPAQFEVER